MSEILNIVVWYLAVTIIGLTALPVVYRLLPGLPLRGFALARPMGLLLWGFIFWLLASLGVLQNDLGGEILAYVLLLGGSVWALRGGKHREILSWCQQNLRTLLTVESLFLLVFIFWVFVRGMNPEVTYTEKPMELAFINSILRSETFPPQDPWLSGYAISYYYFGYILIAMLTRITGTASAVAFNLASATWLALTAAALYGIVYDITSLWAKQNTVQSATSNERFSRNAGLLGPLFVLVISTVEGVLEFLHAGGVFWRRGADGLLTSKFWSWLSILDLNQPPSQPFDWVPSRASGWLWWRGSRVLQDLTLGNQHIEVIDEFPFFSYLLSDLHPHVLAMPFTLLVIALAMNLFIGGDSFLQKSRKVVDWFKDWTFWLTALILGSLAFINTWDFPIYVGLFCLVWAFKVYRKNGWNVAILWDFLKNGLVLGITGVLLYLPFYIGFDSQAGGILPSLAFMTRGVHFWVLFAALLVPILIFSLYIAKSKLDRKSIWTGAKVTLILLALLFIVMMIYGALLLSFQLWGPLLAASQNASISALGAKMSEGGNAFASVYGGYPAREILSQAFLRRLLAPGTWLTLGFLLTITLGALLHRERKTAPGSVTDEEDPPAIGHRDVELFILILVLFGLAADRVS